MERMLFVDRSEAGRRLAAALATYRQSGALVLGVPRGGVVVAAEVARALGAELDVVIARKIGAPDQPELAIGAVVGAEGLRILDERAIRYLRVPAAYIDAETDRQVEEIRRRMEFYRRGRPAPSLEDRTVIVVDDGIATGYTMRAALAALRGGHPRRLVVAVPVAPGGTCDDLRDLADEVVCLETPEPFLAVGAWYDDFEQTTDAQVAELMARAAAGAPVES